MKANETQVGGSHYKTGGEEHWDRVHRLGLDYFQAAITKYVERWKKKGGIQDLEKARHFLDKYIELERDGNGVPTAMAFEVAPLSDNVLVVEPGQVNATGWRDFVFEGAGAEGQLMKCKICRWTGYIPHDGNPYAEHQCGTEPSAAYIDQ